MEDKMVLVCKSKGYVCNELGFKAKVGNVDYTFCCEKGFKDSLIDFQKALKTKE